MREAGTNCSPPDSKYKNEMQSVPGDAVLGMNAKRRFSMIVSQLS